MLPGMTIEILENTRTRTNILFCWIELLESISFVILREVVFLWIWFTNKQVWEQNPGKYDQGDIMVDIYGHVFMPFYNKDIKKYLYERVKDDCPFSDYELALILEGLLCGIEYLNVQKMIIHRDLHPGNVFINPIQGRVRIADLGCACNLSNNPNTNKYIVREESVSVEEISIYRGGLPSYLAPEIAEWETGKEEEDIQEEVEGEEEEEEGNGSIVLNYEENDLWGVGMIGYMLVKSFVKDNIAVKNGPYGPYDISRKPEQVEYVDLGEDFCRKEISELIAGLLVVNMKDRFDHKKALEKIGEIIRLCEGGI